VEEVSSSLFSRQKQGNELHNKKMQVVLEEGCGVSCGTGFRGKSGEYILKTSVITIGSRPFDDNFLTSEQASNFFEGLRGDIKVTDIPLLLLMLQTRCTTRS
jgi:hypothetical protein